MIFFIVLVSRVQYVRVSNRMLFTYLCPMNCRICEISKVADDETDEISTHFDRPLEMRRHQGGVSSPLNSRLRTKRINNIITT